MSQLLGVIPARMGSTRFPGKPLCLINGKPMIEHVYQRAIQSDPVDKVVVATDSKEILSIVKDFGGDAVMTSAEHPTGLDRVIEVIQMRPYSNFSFVMNIQGDEPLIHPETITGVATLLQSGNSVDIATAAIPFETWENFQSPHQVKVVFEKNGRALYFSRSPIPYSDNKEYFSGYKHLGIYGYRREKLLSIQDLKQTPLEKSEKLEQLRFLENGYSIYIHVTKHDSVGVDTPDDLDRVLKAIQGTETRIC